MISAPMDTSGQVSSNVLIFVLKIALGAKVNSAPDARMASH